MSSQQSLLISYTIEPSSDANVADDTDLTSVFMPPAAHLKLSGWINHDAGCMSYATGCPSLKPIYVAIYAIDAPASFIASTNVPSCFFVYSSSMVLDRLSTVLHNVPRISDDVQQMSVHKLSTCSSTRLDIALMSADILLTDESPKSEDSLPANV